MKAGGRKSAAELALVTALPLRMLPVPDDLSDEEAKVWAMAAATKPGDWWDAGNTPLLAQYCRATVQAGLVAEQVRKVAPFLATDDGLGRYKELRKIQSALSGEITTLARSMRLTQQAKYRADAASTADKKATGRKPWQIDVIEG